ncbi:MAG TPA: hypothetical protein VMF86_05510 [Stellaceae bacterium]|nr:hypothetical protein [Stellaceae bacterium]
MPGTIAPIGVGTATLYNRLASAGAPLFEQLADPGDTNPPLAFEPPASLAGGAQPALWIVATGGALWGGCLAFVSTDGDTYAPVGPIYAGARQGVLTAPLPAAADPDTSDTLSVDLTMSRGQLISGTEADANGLVTLCCCDAELIAYAGATLTAQYNYDLTYLRRGAYGTAIAAHAAGAPFARFGPSDPSVLKYPYPASFVGRTLYLKLPSFNLFGQALQSLAEVDATAISLTGAGIAVAPNNPVIAALAAGISPEDWGLVSDAVIAAADFAPLSLAAGLDIDLGTPL